MIGVAELGSEPVVAVLALHGAVGTVVSGVIPLPIALEDGVATVATRHDLEATGREVVVQVVE